MRNTVVKVLDVEGCKIYKAVVLEVAPEVFDGIEFWGVGWQSFEMQSREATAQFTDGRPLVHRPVVPDNDHAATEMPHHLFEEVCDTDIVDGFGRVGLEVEAWAMSLGGNGNRSNHRDLVAMPPILPESWGPASLRKRAADQRREHAAGLVDQDYVRVLIVPFFRIRGHSSRTQRRISRSSRCQESRCGFCGVIPRSVSQALM